MLVLARKTSEVIRIGDDIVITVVEIQRGRVRIGVACPRGIPVCRQELMPHLGDEEPEEPAGPAGREE